MRSEPLMRISEKEQITREKLHTELDETVEVMSAAFTEAEIREILMAKLLSLGRKDTELTYNKIDAFMAKGKVPAFPVTQGFLIPTRQAVCLTPEEQQRLNDQESVMVFSNFTMKDEGRSRTKIGTFEHPDHARLAALSMNFFLSFYGKE